MLSLLHDDLGAKLRWRAVPLLTGAADYLSKRHLALILIGLGWIAAASALADVPSAPGLLPVALSLSVILALAAAASP
jgi:hypothetical protein